MALIVIRQPGTANAFVPLIHALRRSIEGELKVLAYSQAQAILAAAAIPFIPVASFAESLPALNAHAQPQFPQTQFLLTGTSFESEDDSLFWAWAKGRCRSVAFVDQWVNYAERFRLHPQGAFPDEIAAVDEIAAKRIADLALPAVRVAVTGTPVLEQLFVDVQRARATKSLPSAVRRAVFATEPISGPGGESDYRKVNGFLDADALIVAMDGLVEYADATDSYWQLLVKPHPIDSLARVQRLIAPLGKSPRVEPAITAEDRVSLFGSADLVLGTRSMFLYEAAVLGLPTVSLQPNRKTSSDLTDGRPQILVVTDAAAAATAITRALAVGVRNADPLAPEHAACQRFIELLQSKASS